MTRITFALALATLGVTATGCTTVSVRRAALVPHQQPTLRDGQGLGTATGQVDLGVATVVSTALPEEADDNAGLHIPRVQTNGAIRFQPVKNFDLGLIYERGLGKGAKSIAPDQPDTDGDAQGFGLAMGYSIPAGDGVKVGLGLDLINYSVPYVEYRTCVDFCGGVPWTDVNRERVNVPVVAMSVTPSMKRGPWTFFGGLTLRSHPTVERSGIEFGAEDDDDIESGPLNPVVAAGVTFETPARVRFSMLAYQNFSNDPVDYSPTLAVSISLPLGNKYGAPPPAATPMQPAQPGQPPGGPLNPY